jgi:hypothetical protein
MKLAIKLSIFSFFLLFLFACKKEDAKSKTDLLTQKTWMIQKLETKEGNNPWEDDFPTWDACSKDDRYIFRANNTYEFNEGLTKCDPSDPQIFDSGSWSFTNNETKLLIGSDEFTIVSLTETNLILSVQETVGGVAYQIQITFGNK